ncbi:MAG: hypothetical protein M1825_003349 [Sarcosagium campestre]|nr:MAG: hypothetical protein M1825_003349 [Sarcosagium campestre]
MAEETAAKRLKISTPLIGTHNGHFHADEALAVHLLRLLPDYTPSHLVRSRDPAVLSTCHTVVDVGGEYNPSSNRYDHHQRTFKTTFPDCETKLSSAGLVYLHFGKQIIANQAGLPVDSPSVALLWTKLYNSFVEALDAHDNGIDVYDPSALAASGLEKKFSDHGVTLGSLVSDLNPNWNDPVPEDATAAQAAEDDKFLKASKLMGDAFERKLSYFASAWLPARDIVNKAYAERKTHDPRGRVLVFPTPLPWKDHLASVEDENPTEEKVLYTLYPEKTGPGAKWRIQAVAVSQDSFESRKALPEAWRGVRDDKLDAVSGIEGCVFVHASGFTGGNKTWDGVRKMAQKALES